MSDKTRERAYWARRWSEPRAILLVEAPTPERTVPEWVRRASRSTLPAKVFA
jgi:hypothetical protein